MDNTEEQNLSLELQKKRMEIQALSALSEEMAKILDLGEAIDLVNKYLWELIDFSASMYAIYSPQIGDFELRGYVKESVDQNFIDSITDEVFGFINSKADTGVALAAKSALKKKKSPLFFGLPVQKKKSEKISSKYIIPIEVDDNVIGALVLASTKDKNVTQSRELSGTLSYLAPESMCNIKTDEQYDVG